MGIIFTVGMDFFLYLWRYGVGRTGEYDEIFPINRILLGSGLYAENVGNLKMFISILLLAPSCNITTLCFNRTHFHATIRWILPFMEKTSVAAKYIVQLKSNVLVLKGDGSRSKHCS